MPPTKESATTAPPTSIESRVPCTTRLHTSRPTAGASTATSTLSATRTMPSSATRRRRSCRSHHHPGASPLTGRGSLIADSRVERQVHQVDDEIDQGVGDRDDQHHALDLSLIH